MEDTHTQIGPGTCFQGTINTRTLTVEGTVKGEVNAVDNVLIKKGGLIEGPVQTGKISFEEGGRHRGIIKLWKATEADRVANRNKTSEKMEEREDPLKPAEKDEEILKSKKANSQRLW